MMRASRRDILRLIAAAPWLGIIAPTTTHATGNGMQTFALADVRLRDGPYRHAQELDGRYLLLLSPDRLLHNFHVNAGLSPKAPVYGGWESQEPWVDIRCHGHTLGHYLSACAMMWAATGKPAYRERVQYVVAELQACQQAAGSGLVCAFPDGDAQLRNGLAGRSVVGVPWYTLHKVMAGLRDAHTHAGSAPALGVLRRLADWIDDAARDCDDARFQKMLDVEHGGMNEVLADLHALTGEARWLVLAERFNHRALLDPLAEGQDPLDQLHANTQIPKVIGFARLHELTGEPRYARAARHFWNCVSGPRAFATGGHGDFEHFFPPDEVRRHLASAKTMETCGMHNMLRLTRALFLRDPQPAYADWYERALINGILASQDPDTGMVTYFQALRPGYPKLYCTPEHSFWCCTGTGMENHAKYGDSVWFHDGEALYLSQYVASELAWRERQVHIRQETAFPEQAGARLQVRAVRPSSFALRLRHPAWCRVMTVNVNGERVEESHQGGRWIELRRRWRDGDTVDVQLPMHLHLAPLPGADPQAPDIAALMYGPMVLAARLGAAGMAPGADLIVNERTYGDVLDLPEPMPMPRLALSPDALEDAVRPAGGMLAFRVRAQEPATTFELIPYHRIAHERYNLYWRIA
ncbi:glycoside hydrolase family 127 protein [Marilutibacter chinensis]|uniref:Glycoside hydrolase family 127 protein n=1 Tax=Marilutibacter chinensis TaxID=2912247 RepID=A0ABS9HPU3_9GAMM|nr:glycoside hydrolase family 127 protein [Lysobacter chinensis]MCF7220380.1 glycoside hydrolase family 127 protein [Lysobacter chinensis]